jgi:hypothetical protein
MTRDGSVPDPRPQSAEAQEDDVVVWNGTATAPARRRGERAAGRGQSGSNGTEIPGSRPSRTPRVTAVAP